MKKTTARFLAFSIISALATFICVFDKPVLATKIDELREQISEYNNQIAELEKEIKEYQKQIDVASKESKTLNNQILQLETRIKKFKTDITLTEKQILAADTLLEEITIGIQTKEKEIEKTKQLLGEVIRSMDEIESRTLVEVLLAHSSLSDFFGDLERMKDFQNSVNVNLGQLKQLKSDFQKQEEEKETEKKELERLKSKLADQKILVEDQKTQKNSLLKETKNRESAYKELLTETQKKQAALEAEIQEIENQIRIEIDPSSLPKTGSGVLFWPIDPPIVVTQYFGNTPFATQNPQVYGGKGHNGVDFRAAIGTPIKSAQSGVVTNTGNTDTSCRGVSYGKWVLVKHDNNLSTLYAHLSLIRVSPGQSVETGQIIGYSGDTGYSTGPHLHFGVFATQAIAGFEYKSKICATTMKLPIVAPSGYLNPLSYL